MYTILTRGEVRLVNDAGEITRAACDWKYSGGWKAVALVRRNNFGNVVEVVPFHRWQEVIPRLDAMPTGSGWYHNNGREKWTCRDLDHGTVCEWGSMLDRVYIGNPYHKPVFA
jgi:hypothetical protein